MHSWSYADTPSHASLGCCCYMARKCYRLCKRELLCPVTQVARVRSGVRALPQKIGDGAVPLAGKLPSGGDMHKYIPDKSYVKCALHVSHLERQRQCCLLALLLAHHYVAGGA